ncbi:MAG: aspartate--ammonia ligase [Lachnospiraceae bacterium]|nr:aspartate--ammonia ligase [Lachnospiraceae bacterium]
MSIIIPEGYKSTTSYKETQVAIKDVKDCFERMLAKELNLTRVSAPLFVLPESGLNDNLNGVERPVSFGIKERADEKVEIVHSLAKWKRKALRDYGFKKGEGLYTDMTAIRRDEDTDNLHSVYVDQWDWEYIIGKKDRTVSTLKSIVRKVYEAIRNTEVFINSRYPSIKCILPENIKFITTQELLDMWPDKTPKEREKEAAKKYKAVFLMQIGDKLSNGEPHDGRAPDYDDWSLNGDIIVYYPLLDTGLELSSMGIRVDEDSLRDQLQKAGCIEREKYPFHKDILEGRLPYTVGGGIGQSRICMFFLRKAHIGEVQSSIWLDEDKKAAELAGIRLL